MTCHFIINYLQVYSFDSFITENSKIETQHLSEIILHMITCTVSVTGIFTEQMISVLLNSSSLNIFHQLFVVSEINLSCHLAILMIITMVLQQSACKQAIVQLEYFLLIQEEINTSSIFTGQRIQKTFNCDCLMKKRKNQKSKICLTPTTWK